MAGRPPPLGHRDLDFARLQTMEAVSLDEKLQEVSGDSLRRRNKTRRLEGLSREATGPWGCGVPQGQGQDDFREK